MGSAFASRLRTLRQRRQLTQRELADRAGYSQTFISQLERGLRPVNTAGLVDRFASVLDVPPTHFESGADAR